MSHSTENLAPITLSVLSDSSAETRGIVNLEGGLPWIIKGVNSQDFLCGKCGAHLLSKPTNLSMVGAIKCKSCDTYNDLYKSSVYANAPITVKDIPKLDSPKLGKVNFNSAYSAPHESTFAALADKIEKAWNEIEGECPKILYHYTSFNGLSGILNSNEMWFSDAMYLNDLSEMKVGHSEIRSFIEEIASDLPVTNVELLKRSSASLMSEKAGTGYLLACCCMNGDLLSQWRAYGGSGGGFAVGLNSNAIAAADDLLLRKVIYSQEEMKQLVSSIVETTLKSSNAIAKNKTVKTLDAEKVLPAFSDFLSSHFRQLLFSFKHETFKEENEWRVVFEFHRHLNVQSLSFRQSNDFPVPYMSKPISKIETGSPKFPILEVVYGPTLQPELTKKAVHMLLEKHNYEFAEVVGSNVPLRA